MIKKKKASTIVTGLLAVMLSVILAINIYLAIEQMPIGYSLIADAFALTPILFINYSGTKFINAELKRRNID